MSKGMSRADLRRFVERDYPAVVAAVTAATRDRDHAEDAVQEALAKVITDGHTPENRAAWVTVVAINHLRSKHRRS